MTQPTLIADRDNDNALLGGWDAQSGTLSVRAEPRLGALNIWLRFRLEGLTPGQTLRLQTLDLDPVARDASLYLSWDGGGTWSRTAQAEPPYVIEVQGATLEVSRNLPYPYRRLQKWREHFACQLPASVGNVTTLCQSPDGRDVPLFQTAPPSADCPLIWVQARAHAFESHSSRVAEALINWVASEDGRFLRERAMICIVPMVDVDAVAVGSSGKKRTPHDFNRDYVQEIYPQTTAIKQRIEELTQTHPLHIFIDAHSPYFRGGCHWYVAPDEREHLAVLTDRFPQVLARIEAANSWHDKLFDYSRGNFVADPQLVAASLWARRRWPNAISTTMEIAHDVDADGKSITPAGLIDFARGLGLCFEACLDAVAK